MRMALPSFLKRKDPAATAQGEAAAVAQARARSRRRMIGAAVLLMVGVIAFPLLFETQPRPIPVDIPIEIPRKEGLPPVVAPPKAPRISTGQVQEPATAPAAVPQVEPAAAMPKPEAKPAPAPEAKPAEPKVPPKPEAAAAPKPKPVDKPAPPAPKEVKPASADKAAPETKAAADSRWVVQVGAFADATAARDVRLKIEKMGLKTYTQIVQTEQGRRTRVRLGPFATQDEANRTLARLKAAGLPGAVFAL
jgi:DedD protein